MPLAAQRLRSPTPSLQERFSPNAVCFGCGPANPKGLHLHSTPDGDGVVADWTPEPHHTAFAGFTNGGIISVLMDCHGNMAAAWALMKARGLDAPPGTVTAELQVRFLKPTPVGGVLHLSARATSVDRDKVAVEGTLESGGVRTATMKGTYVAVRQGHPGFEKWS